MALLLMPYRFALQCMGATKPPPPPPSLSNPGLPVTFFGTGCDRQSNPGLFHRHTKQVRLISSASLVTIWSRNCFLSLYLGTWSGGIRFPCCNAAVRKKRRNRSREKEKKRQERRGGKGGGKIKDRVKEGGEKKDQRRQK